MTRPDHVLISAHVEDAGGDVVVGLSDQEIPIELAERILGRLVAAGLGDQPLALRLRQSLQRLAQRIEDAR